MIEFDIGSVSSTCVPEEKTYSLGVVGRTYASFDRMLHRSLCKIFGNERLNFAVYANRISRNSAIRQILNQESKLGKHFSPKELGKLSLLWFTVLGGYERSTELLVRFGADVNEPFGHHEPQIIDEKWTVLHVLVQTSENSRLIRHVTCRGNADMKIRDSAGRSILHFAVKLDLLRATEMFLERGADVNAADKNGETPLLIVARKHRLEAFQRLLIEHGADLTAKNSDGENILHILAFAALGRDDVEQILELAKIAIAKGVSLDDKTHADQQQPIHRAVFWGNVEVVKFYLNSGANPNALAKYRESPLYLASCRQDSKVLETLLESGAKVDQKTTNGRSALHKACEYFCERNIESLIHAGADVLLEDDEGRTPFSFIKPEYRNTENPSIKLILETMARRKIGFPHWSEFKDEAYIRHRHPQLWEYFQQCVASVFNAEAPKKSLVKVMLSVGV